MQHIDWQAATERARRHYEELAMSKPGHKMPAWEGLPDTLRMDLILRSAIQCAGAVNDR